MHSQLEDIDQKPCNPAVPFLEGREELGDKDKHCDTGIQIWYRV